FNPRGIAYRLDTSPAVTRVTATSSRAGITHAYDFPGGSIGTEAGAELIDTGGATLRCFQEATDDWSNEDVTFEIWFQPDSLTQAAANGAIILEDGGGTGIGLFLNDDVLEYRKLPNGGLITSNISTLAGDYIQAVGTYDVSSGAMTFYVNGVLVGTDTATGGDWTGGDAGALGTRGEANVGGLGGGQQSTESFDGKIALFRIYRNQILSASEVQDNFDAVNDGDSEPPVIAGPADVTIACGGNTSLYEIPAGPIVHWTMNPADVTGSSIEDISDSAIDHDGTMNGGGVVTHGTGQRGDSIVFNGANNDCITTPNHPELNATTISQRSIAFWFNATAVASATPQVLFEEGGTGNGINVFIRNGLVYGGAWAGGLAFTAFPNSAISAATWHHVAIVLDTTSATVDGTFKLYLDGVEVG
ncbi:MAG: LamG domain-containing protein, partial [Verrucomicrobiota bacterium]